MSWGQYANAINRIAHRMIEIAGTPEPGTFPTIAYIGPNDVRYLVIVMAAIKAGFKVHKSLPTHRPRRLPRDVFEQ